MRFYVLLFLIGANFSACKIGQKSDSGAKTVIRDAAGNHMGNVAVTLLSFRDQELGDWERNVRLQCGDHRPRPSRIDDLHYELQPESVYRALHKVQPGDHATCRYQDSGHEADLFRDKPLAIKVKYPRQHSNLPPPVIDFVSGMGVRVDPDKFRSLFEGNCSEFVQSGDGLLYCKTSDRGDGRVIWLSLVAPQNSAYIPTTAGVGGKVWDVAQSPSQLSKMPSKVVKSNVQSNVQSPTKTVTKDTAQSPVQVPSKGGIVGQHGVSSMAGRIDMQISLPYMSGSPIRLAVNVPHFNFELLNKLHSPGDFIFDHPDSSPYKIDLGDELEQEEVIVLVESPISYKNSSEQETLRLTIKSTESRPQEGRWSGVGKIALGLGAIVGGVAAAGLLLPSGLAVLGGATVIGAGKLAVGAIGIGAAGAGGGGALLGGAGIKDLLKWEKTLANKGTRMSYVVNTSGAGCPPVRHKPFVLTEKDRYLTFKAEKRGITWRNMGEIEAVPRSSIGINRWTVVASGEDTFKIFLCRKEYERQCNETDLSYQSMYSENVKTRITECRKMGDDKVFGEFGE